MAAGCIRPAGEKDAERLAAISAQDRDCWSADAFLQTMRQEVACVLVFEEERAPDGSGILGFAAVYYDEDGSELVQIAVDQTRRREHIAARMMDAVFLYLREKNVPRIMLEVRAGNLPAIGLYKQKGFEKIHVKKDFYRRPQEDALVMLRELQN